MSEEKNVTPQEIFLMDEDDLKKRAAVLGKRIEKIKEHIRGRGLDPEAIEAKYRAYVGERKIKEYNTELGEVPERARDVFAEYWLNMHLAMQDLLYYDSDLFQYRFRGHQLEKIFKVMGANGITLMDLLDPSLPNLDIDSVFSINRYSEAQLPTGDTFIVF